MQFFYDIFEDFSGPYYFSAGPRVFVKVLGFF